MIIKNLSRKSNTGQLVNYIFRYVFRDQDKNKDFAKQEHSKREPGKFIIRHNVRSRSTKGLVREFKENEAFRLVNRRDSVKIFHTIISFSNKDKDKITDSMLKDIAQKFIQERGINNLYAGTKHEDKDHVHLHIAVSGTQLNGRSSRMSNQKLKSIKLALDRYQREKYPSLVHSLPEHNKSKEVTKEAIIQTIKAGRQSNKETLLTSLEKIYRDSGSSQHFLIQLKTIGEPYYRNNKFQGVKYEGIKYRINRLGFDEGKLKALDQKQLLENKELAELKNLRSGRDRELKRSIEEPKQDKANLAMLDTNEQKIMDELSAVRGGHDNSEKERSDTNEENDKGHDEEELNNKADEEEENDDIQSNYETFESDTDEV